jgi:uncharacterized iron-regulated membrane protein
VLEETAASGPQTEGVTIPAPPHRRRRRRWRKIRAALVFTHRWLALILGIALLAVVISGVVLLYEQEIDRVVHPELHHVTKSADPISHSEALAVVRRDAPGFKPSDVVDSHGVYLVYDTDYEKHAYVDPGSGRLNGIDDTTDGVMGFLYNLHLCGLSCKGYPAYLGFLEKPAHVLGNDELTVGGLILGVTGLMLLFLAVTGLVVWWPGIKRMARGLRLRRRSGTYAFNYDLHNVVGIAALPFLVMWGLTGAHFEFKQVSDLWYAVLPGHASPEREVVSKPVKGQSVTMDQAAAIARRTVPDGRLVSVSVPDAKDKTSTYFAYLAVGNDPYDHGVYPGNVGVTIDRYSGKATVTYPGQDDPPLSAQIVDDWFYPLHAGTFINGWWRTVWLVLGTVPVVLGVTGVITWLIRRGKRRRKRRRREEAAAAAA